MNKYLEKIAEIKIKPSHQGALHQQLGISKDDTLSNADLAKAKASAKESGDTKLMRRVIFAENARKWRHK